jgi:hypothetical protein
MVARLPAVLGEEKSVSGDGRLLGALLDWALLRKEIARMAHGTLEPCHDAIRFH